MRPVVFSDTIGWLHPAAGSRGVVIAGAHGLDDLCSRRFLTMMARRMAAAGLPVLQFDYPGCGDAAGDHDAPGRVPAWTASIGEAIDRLKRETGVDDVLLVGFRLGAMLAPEAVAARADVAALALLAPPPSGKAYIRELTGLSRMIDATLPAQAETIDGLEQFQEKCEAVFRPELRSSKEKERVCDSEKSGHALQAAGFRLTGETIAALAGLDWRAALARTPVREILLMPAAPSPQVDRLVGEMKAAGREAEATIFEGYHRLMCDPTASVIPEPAIAALVAWAGARAGRPRRTEMRPGTADRLEGPHYRERPVVIGGGPEICGVLCLPAERGEPDEAVLFLNAGGVPHVGWARGTVEAARALAARGTASLRIDLPGLGQSETPSGKRLFLYDMRTRTDIMRVVDWLESAGFRRICATGTCSGAFQAFHAARQDARISSIAMVNPLCFAWNSSYALDMGAWKVYENARAGRSRVEDEGEPLAGTGPMAALRAAASLGGRRLIRRILETMKSGLADLAPARLLRGRPVERWMADLTARGTRVLMINSEGDLSLVEVARHFGEEGRRLARLPGVTMRRIPACDHTVTPPHGRRALAAHLAQFVHSGTAGTRAGAPVDPEPVERLQTAGSGA